MTSLALVAAPTQAETALLQLEDLRTQLTTPDLQLDETLTARDKAEVLRAYAHSAKLGLDVANQATELRLRAERRAGVLLRELLGHRRALPNGTLERAGITSQQSCHWMAIAQIPDDEFDVRIEATTGAGRQLSVASFVRAARQFLRQPGKGGNGPASPTLNALRKAFQLLREIKDVRTEAELELARGIAAICESWAIVLEPTATATATPSGVVREVTCMLCGRDRPATRPPRCPVCGGAWFTA